MKKKILCLPLILLFLLSNCGFKLANQSTLKNYKIQDLLLTGNKQVNFRLKNEILSNSNNNSSKLIFLEFETNKDKSVKEKNIKNEITKYELQITIITKYKVLGGNKSKSFTSVVKSDYNVSKKYAQTLTNEINTINVLTEKISNNIIRKLAEDLNDL